jgi:hypothetical protein
MRTPRGKAVTDRWRQTINKRLQYDKILTRKDVFGKKSLDVDTVRDTWERVIYTPNTNEPHLPKDWVTNKGVLVGIPESRRPPGRNR